MDLKPVYAIIGCGMQGTAEAYDLVRFGNASTVIMADWDFALAEKSADRINLLANSLVARPLHLDASNQADVVSMLRDNHVTVCCGAAHYALNLVLTQACIEAGTHFCDMGGNTDIVMLQHDLNDAAVQKGVAVVPDCGIAPGTANILAARAIQRINGTSVRIFCGGLPQSRELPLGYRVVFSISGLTNEYTGTCSELRNGRLVDVPAFTEKETIVLPEPVGNCEAFLTSGGSSTGPLSFTGKLDHYSYKTVRYPGHFDVIRSMIDMGLLSLNPIEVDGRTIIPRNVFHALASRYWNYPDEPDLLVLRVIATGTDDNGRPVQMVQDILDVHDPQTGFTAMERTTAFSAAIVAKALSSGLLKPGVHFLERSVDPEWFVLELESRRIPVTSVINLL